jgi:hypothetical protein
MLLNKSILRALLLSCSIASLSAFSNPAFGIRRHSLQPLSISASDEHADTPDERRIMEFTNLEPLPENYEW